MEETSNTRKEH